MQSVDTGLAGGSSIAVDLGSQLGKIEGGILGGSHAAEMKERRQLICMQRVTGRTHGPGGGVEKSTW